ncbi:MAG: hypothetical protein MUP22_03615, partial [Desulfobacterales bacterium]|nr:hypothetical protein [Desulfobacterales bacterium]
LNFKTKTTALVFPLIITLITLSLPSGWWYARNAIKLGDPIYPFTSGNIFYDNHGNKLKLSPAINKHLENTPAREDIETVLIETGLHGFIDWEDNKEQPSGRSIMKYWRMGLFNFWDILTNPEKYERKPYHEINPLLILFFLLPFFNRSKISLYLYGIGCFVFIFIALKTHILRYALPVFPLFAIGASQVLSRLPKKLTFVGISIIAVFLFRFSYLEADKLIMKMRPFAYLSGNEERIDWLEKVGYNWDRTTPPFIKFANQQINNDLITKGDIIFMIGEGKGDLLKCNYLPDSSRSALPWLEELIKSNNDYHTIVKSLKGRGINYLAINYFYLYWSFINSNDYPKSLIFGLYHLQLFLENHTEIIYNNEGVVLAQIK